MTYKEQIIFCAKSYAGMVNDLCSCMECRKLKDRPIEEYVDFINRVNGFAIKCKDVEMALLLL